MGNAMGVLWRAAFGEPVPPSTILVPPLFKPDGVSQRSSSAKSGYQAAFRPGPLKQLMQDYLLSSGGLTGAPSTHGASASAVTHKKSCVPHEQRCTPWPGHCRWPSFW